MQALKRGTFHVEPRKMVFKVVNRREQHFHVQYELLGHPNGIQVLPIADLSQHIRDTGSTRLLECR